MPDEIEQTPVIVDPSGRPARQASRPVIDTRCPRCRIECPPGDEKKRVPSGGFGSAIHDVCVTCGYDFEGERTV